jgi:DNA-binding transcriptional MocR family regulator
MDTDGRVIRFDSVSKSLAPGVRIGWVTTTPEFISKFTLLQECTTQVTNAQCLFSRFATFSFLIYLVVFVLL